MRSMNDTLYIYIYIRTYCKKPHIREGGKDRKVVLDVYFIYPELKTIKTNRTKQRKRNRSISDIT